MAIKINNEEDFDQYLNSLKSDFYETMSSVFDGEVSVTWNGSLPTLVLSDKIAHRQEEVVNFAVNYALLCGIGLEFDDAKQQ